MVVKCSLCEEEFDIEKFPVCPYCGTLPELKPLKEDVEAEIKTEYKVSGTKKHTEKVNVVCAIDYEVNIDTTESQKTTTDSVDCFSQDTAQIEKIKHEQDIDLSSIHIENIEWLSKRAKNCLRRHEIFTVSDLKPYVENGMLSDIRNIGTKTINEVEDFYRDMISGEIVFSPVDNSHDTKDDMTELVVVNEEISKLTVETLQYFGISRASLNKVKKSGCLYLKDLNLKTSMYIASMLKEDEYAILFEQYNILEKDPSQYFEAILLALESDSRYKILLSRANGMTLEEVGAEHNLTRERIRQIEKKFIKGLIPTVDCLIQSVSNDTRYITVQELVDVYDNDDYDRVLVYLCKKDIQKVYFDFAEMFWLTPSGSEIENKVLKTMIDVIEDGFDLDSKSNMIEDILEEIDIDYFSIDDIKSLMIKNGYKAYGNLLVNGSKSYGYLCARIVQEYFPKGIKLNQNDAVPEPDLVLLRKLLHQRYGQINVSESDRAFSSRISEFLVISDRGYATAKENVEVELTALEQVIEYIEQFDSDRIYYRQIFSEYQGLLGMTGNVDNYHFLHGVLMLYYPEHYVYSRDYLEKKQGNGNTMTVQSMLLSYINEQGKPVHRDEFKRKFGFSEIMIYTATASEPRLIQWEYNYFYSMDLIELSGNEINLLKEELLILLNTHSGYCSEYLYYSKVKANLKGWINRNGIRNPKNLFYISEHLFGNICEFRRPHICSKGKYTEFTVKNIALEMLGHPERFFYSEYKKLGDKMLWSDVTLGMVFMDIEQNYFRISQDEYILGELFEIKSYQVAEIEEALSKLLRHGKVSLLNFGEWDILPKIDYEWNSFILESIIRNYSSSFRIIEQDMKDRRYQRGIIVLAESQNTSYPDLVANVMKSNGITIMTEGQMLSFLVVHGFTYKLIPKEIYNCEQLRYKNELFEINDKS